MRIKGSAVLAEAVQIAQAAELLHEKIAKFTAWAGKELSMETIEAMADTLFALNRAGRTAEATRIALDRFHTLGVRPWVLRWVQAAINTGQRKAVKGQLCMAHGTIKPSLILPSRTKDPERYAALMKKMGVPQQMVDDGVLQIHWPSAVDFYAKKLEAGEELPDELRPTDTAPRFNASYTPNKDVPLREVEVEVQASRRTRDPAELGVQHVGDSEIVDA